MGQHGFSEVAYRVIDARLLLLIRPPLLNSAGLSKCIGDFAPIEICNAELLLNCRPTRSHPVLHDMDVIPLGVRFQLLKSFRDRLLGIRRVVETRGLSRRIRIVDDKHPAAIRSAAHYLGAQPLRRRWWAERPCAVEYGQSFAGFDDSPCLEFHASAT